MDKIDRLIHIIHTLKEEGMIANVVGTGENSLGYNIETETPPVGNRRKRPPVIARGLMPGARTRWKKGLR